MNAYLAEYGQRGTSWSLAGPSWIEDPPPVIKNLQDYVGQADEADPRLRLAAQAEERAAALATARERLAGYPEQASWQFEFLVQAAQVGTVLSEDHGFWIDFRSSYRIRMVLVEAGRRLAAAGAIVDADDVFHLGSGEVRDALADGGDQQALVAGRKADLECNSAVRPPMLFGTDYGPPWASSSARPSRRPRRRVVSTAIPARRARCRAPPGSSARSPRRRSSGRATCW